MLLLDRQAKALKKQEDGLAAALMAEMKRLGVTECNGVSMRTVMEPVLVDYSKLEAYIIEHKALDLLQKRLTPTAVRLRWEDGIAIPGVDKYEAQKLSYKE